MKAIILKPVMWNTTNYTQPSGYPSSGGYSHKYGYGHEEWNNDDRRIWRDYKIFHTEAKDKLFKYSATGELGILMTASFEKKQYAIGIATSVYNNDDEERNLIAEELDVYKDWKQVWALDIVKNKFNQDQDSFFEHWNSHYRGGKWKCPVDQYFHFEIPLLIKPKKISGKDKIIAMHGSYQAVYPE